MFLNNARIIQFENPLSWSFPCCRSCRMARKFLYPTATRWWQTAQWIPSRRRNWLPVMTSTICALRCLGHCFAVVSRSCRTRIIVVSFGRPKIQKNWHVEFWIWFWMVLGFNPTTLSIPTSNAKLPKEWLHEGRRSKSAHPPGRWRLEKESRALWRLWNPSTIFWASSSWIPPLPWSLSESERTARVRVLGSFCWMVAMHHTASLFSKWFLSNSNVYDFQWWYQTTTLLVFSDATFNRCRCTHVLIEQFESWLQDQCFRGIPGIWIGGVIQLAMAVKTLKTNQIFAHVKLHSLMCQPFHSHQMHMHMSQRYGKVWCSKCLW